MKMLLIVLDNTPNASVEGSLLAGDARLVGKDPRRLAIAISDV
jgi:hypothetical protein